GPGARPRRARRIPEVLRTEAGRIDLFWRRKGSPYAAYRLLWRSPKPLWLDPVTSLESEWSNAPQHKSALLAGRRARQRRRFDLAERNGSAAAVGSSRTGGCCLKLSLD